MITEQKINKLKIAEARNKVVDAVKIALEIACPRSLANEFVPFPLIETNEEKRTVTVRGLVEYKVSLKGYVTAKKLINAKTFELPVGNPVSLMAGYENSLPDLENLISNAIYEKLGQSIYPRNNQKIGQRFSGIKSDLSISNAVVEYCEVIESQTHINGLETREALESLVKYLKYRLPLSVPRIAGVRSMHAMGVVTQTKITDILNKDQKLKNLRSRFRWIIGKSFDIRVWNFLVDCEPLLNQIRSDCPRLAAPFFLWAFSDHLKSETKYVKDIYASISGQNDFDAAMAGQGKVADQEKDPYVKELGVDYWRKIDPKKALSEWRQILISQFRLTPLGWREMCKLNPIQIMPLFRSGTELKILSLLAARQSPGRHLVSAWLCLPWERLLRDPALDGLITASMKELEKRCKGKSRKNPKKLIKISPNQTVERKSPSPYKLAAISVSFDLRQIFDALNTQPGVCPIPPERLIEMGRTWPTSSIEDTPTIPVKAGWTWYMRHSDKWHTIKQILDEERWKLIAEYNALQEI